MKVYIKMSEDEFNDLLSRIPRYTDGTKKRRDLAKLAAKECNIPFESLNFVCVDLNTSITSVWEKR